MTLIPYFSCCLIYVSASMASISTVPYSVCVVSGLLNDIGGIHKIIIPVSGGRPAATAGKNKKTMSHRRAQPQAYTTLLAPGVQSGCLLIMHTIQDCVDQPSALTMTGAPHKATTYTISVEYKGDSINITKLYKALDKHTCVVRMDDELRPPRPAQLVVTVRYRHFVPLLAKAPIDPIRTVPLRTLDVAKLSERHYRDDLIEAIAALVEGIQLCVIPEAVYADTSYWTLGLAFPVGSGADAIRLVIQRAHGLWSWRSLLQLVDVFMRTRGDASPFNEAVVLKNCADRSVFITLTSKEQRAASGIHTSPRKRLRRLYT